MLSSIAESVVAIGRDVERADGAARILDVHLQLLLDEPWMDEDATCRGLLGVLGSVAPVDGPLGRGDVLAMLAVDRHNPASIAYSLGAAREDARRARETVSGELWECLNTTRSRMPRKVASDKVHEFFAWVRERSTLAIGIIETATRRDEVWDLFTLGRSIERADMTARLLADERLAEIAGSGWATALRSCGAYEAYLRMHPGGLTEREAAAFLLTDPLFPRSVLFSVRRAEECLRGLGPGRDLGGAADGDGEDATERLLGEVRTMLEGAPVASISEHLPARMERVHRATTRASEALRTRLTSPGGTRAAGRRP